MLIMMAYLTIRPVTPMAVRWVRTGLRLLGVLAWLSFALLCWIELFGG